MLKTTAQRLQYVRKHVLRISQAELAQKMGISAPSLQIEKMAIPLLRSLAKI